jgi:hypothetical protein
VSIGRAGDRLAAFLEEDPLSSELPFLPDLARYAQDLADEDVSIPLGPVPSTVLVHRAGLEVRRRLVGEDDARFLEAAAGGLRLSDLLHGASGEAEAAALVERFRLGVVNELFEKPGPARDAASH